MSEANHWFDATCMLGRWSAGIESAPATAAALVENLAFHGIAEALVYHSAALMYNPHAGNLQLMAEIAPYPNLHPCWVLIPDETGETPPVTQVMASLLGSGVRAALLLPRSYRFSLRRWNLGPILDQLAAHRIPTFVDFGQRHWDGEAVDWDGLYEIGSAYPDLPLILVRADIAGDRRLFPLMKRLPNLHLDSSYYCVHRGIELICRSVGPERVLFGTGLPYRAPGAALSALLYGGLNESELALVGGDNLRRLLKGVIV